MISLRLPGFGASIPKGPEPVDREAVQAEADRERARQLRQRRGRGATVMTSPLGIQDEPQTAQRPTLLGG